MLRRSEAYQFNASSRVLCNNSSSMCFLDRNGRKPSNNGVDPCVNRNNATFLPPTFLRSMESIQDRCGVDSRMFPRLSYFAWQMKLFHITATFLFSVTFTLNVGNWCHNGHFFIGDVLSVTFCNISFDSLTRVSKMSLAHSKLY